MFGYIRPYKPELLVKDFECYRGVYCSLCKQLGKSFGLLSRLTLSYDCTFLALLCLSLEENCPGFRKGRCVVNPFKKCSYCGGGEEALTFCAAVAVVMTYHKLRDDLRDSRFFGKLRALFLLPAAAWERRRARRRFPDVETIVAKAMKEQSLAERDPLTGLDAAADPTAQMLAALLELRGHGEEEKQTLRQFGYFIGRWIYLMDAADDMEKDEKQKSFNPFLRKQKTMPALQGEEIYPYCNEVLNQTLSQALYYYERLSLRHFTAILTNTITRGLPLEQKELLFERKKKYVRSL